MRALAPWLVAGILLSACDSGSAPGSTSPRDEIIIASDLPASGFESNALPAQQAIAFAIQQQRTIAGYPLRYWPLDDSLAANPSPARAVGNMQQMVDTRQVLGMIGPFTSNVAPYEIPIANLEDLAMLSPSNTNDCLTLSYCNPNEVALRPTSRNNYFRIAAPDPVQGRAMARYAAQRLGVTRAAAFNDIGFEGEPIIKEFADELTRHGGQVVLEQNLVASDAPDYSKFLTQARSLGAQAVYAVGLAADNHDCRARAQMETLLPNSYFLTWDGITTSEDCFGDAGTDTSNMFGTFSDVDPRRVSRVSKDVTAYLKAYTRASDVSIYTFAAYDCARIMIAAIAQAIRDNHGAVPSRPQVVAALARTQGFKGVTGTYSFDANGDALSPLMSIYTVQNGKWSYLEQIDASKEG